MTDSIVNCVNGSAPYTYVSFHGQRIEFHDGEWDLDNERDAGSAKAAAYAAKINDGLFELAKSAASLAALSPSPVREEAGKRTRASFASNWPPQSSVEIIMPDHKLLVERLLEGAQSIRNDGTPSQVGPDETELEQAATAITSLSHKLEEMSPRVERLGEALAFLSGRLLKIGALESDNVHAAYEKVVAEFQVLSDHVGEEKTD